MSDDFDVMDMVNGRWHRLIGIGLKVILAVLGLIMVVNITRLLLIVF